MKKKLITLNLFAVLFFSNCGIGFHQVKNNFDSKIMEKTYGSFWDNSQFIFNSYEFENYMNMIKEDISSNGNYTDSEKEKIAKELEKYQYSDNKYIIYTLISTKLALNKNLKFQFNLKSSKNEPLIEKIFFVKIKKTTVQMQKDFVQVGPQETYSETGRHVKYQYIWIIASKKQISSKNFNSNDKVTLDVRNPFNEVKTFALPLL